MTAQAGSASSLRQHLRRQMRQLRRQLSATARDQAHRQFARLLSGSHRLRPEQRIGVYIAYGHEADLHYVIDVARRRGCLLYLPVITDFRHSRMRFVRYRTDSVMRVNRYGIAEPDPRHADVIPVRKLDLILLPLVAFDARGWRLGSGAGYYDRALHHLRAGRRWRRPKLIGVGYECQRVARLQPDAWDVPLDGMLTERGLRYFTQQDRSMESS